MKFILKLSEEEIKAINHLKDDINAMIGGSDEETDELWREKVEIINKMFIRNKVVFTKGRIRT